jgi:hypothetical protein
VIGDSDVGDLHVGDLHVAGDAALCFTWHTARSAVCERLGRAIVPTSYASESLFVASNNPAALPIASPFHVKLAFSLEGVPD